MPAVPFKQIPASLVVPGAYAEIDNSQANPAASNLRALLIGSMTSAGTAAANLPSRILSPADAANQFGPGSILADMMLNGYYPGDSFGEVWGLPLADAGAAAAGSIAFSGTATAAGAISLYIAGDLVSTPVTVGMTAVQAAAAVVASIGAVNTYLVTATVDGTTASKVDLVAKSASLASNDIDLRLNYLGASNGQAVPAGLTASLVAMTGGATNPTLTTALANLNELPFEFIACAYNDTASITAITGLLNDATGRWSWQIQIYGHGFIAYRGTVSAAGTFTSGVNNQHLTCMPFYDSPSPVWRWAAGLAAASAVSVRANPAAPIRGMTLAGVLAPPLASRYSTPNRNALILDGAATWDVEASGAVIVEKVTTTYIANAQGQPDQSYRNAERMFLIAFLLRDLANLVSRFQTYDLAEDGTPFAPGSNIVTPSTVKGLVLARYLELEYNGYVQNSPLFKSLLQVTINAQNVNRLDILYPAIVIEQLDVIATLFQFRLQ